MQNLPNERDDVMGRRVVRVAEELHQRVHDTRGHFRELDGSYVNRLNEELPILRGLVRIKVLDTNLSNMGGGTEHTLS